MKVSIANFVEKSVMKNRFSCRNGIENASNVSQSVQMTIINHQQNHMDLNKAQNPVIPSVAGITPPQKILPLANQKLT